MNKYIVIAFAFLGVWFYEASGGADFEPGVTSLAVFAESKPDATLAETPRELVAHSDTLAEPTETVPEGATSTLAEVEPAEVEPTAVELMGLTTGLTLVTLAAPVVEIPVFETEPEVEFAVAAPAAEDVAAPAPEIEEPFLDLRFVDGDRVNMRGGPGTDYEVVGKLVRNDMVEVLEDDGSGWLHLRDTASGQEGWMADWLVTASN